MLSTNQRGKEEVQPAHRGHTWKILVVDDEPSVFDITDMILSGHEFMNRPLELLAAYTEDEARHLLSTTEDIAVVLLDVVMSRNDSGLLLVHFIRDELHLKKTRIILRTGQPGYAPDKQVIIDYDINDYKLKTDLTAGKLYISVIAALRSYNDLIQIEQNHQQLLQSQKMDIIGQMASGIAHDFNNMIGSIINAAEQLELNGSDEDKKLKEIILEAGFQASGLSRQLLDFSRKSTQKSDPVDLHLTLKKAQKILKRLIPENIKITLNLNAEKSRILGDENQLLNCIINLANNGAQAMKGKGILSLETENKEKETISLSINDQGEGIPSDKLEKIFEPFYTNKDEGKGTGLGLALVKKTVESHKGIIEVRSKPGTGSSFTLTFPLSHS